MNFKDLSILVTGGTGSFGKRFIQRMLNTYHPARLIVFSRDEWKQHDMYTNGFDHPSLRYFIGDVRNLNRLKRAFRGVDIVVHAAALKQVPACEYNPMEAVATNIQGGANVIEAALDCKVKKVIALSTDKAAAPTNLYGATKLVAEKIFIQANSYSGYGGTSFSCVRYGNVVGSRGSVVPLFLQQRASGKVTVTDQRMTRFWITLDQGVDFVTCAIERAQGGEIFIPKIPSMSVSDLATAIAPGCEIEYTGIRPGEKLHEVLITEDEARHCLEMDDMYIITPAHPWWQERSWPSAKPLAEGFTFASDTNTRWLSREEIVKMVEEI